MWQIMDEIKKLMQVDETAKKNCEIIAYVWTVVNFIKTREYTKSFFYTVSYNIKCDNLINHSCMWVR